MLLLLLALFSNFNIGQLQSDYKDVYTRVITNEANAQEVAHEGSVRTVESATVFTVTLPPFTQRSYETIQLKPVVTDISLPAIIHDTRMMPTGLEKTLHAKGSTNAFDIAAPPQKIQLNIAQETITLKPTISVSDISLPTIIQGTRMMPTEPEKTLLAGGSTNAFDIAAPPQKIQLNIAQETITLKPKISVADISLPTIIQGTRMMPTEPEKPLLTGESTNTFDIAAPPPKIHFNITHETIGLKPKISNVIYQTSNELTQGADWDIARGTSVDGFNGEDSVNVIKVGAPQPKIQLNIKQETIKLQPKITDVISETFNGITEETIQGTAPRVNIQGIDKASPYSGQSPTVINIAAPPPPKIQLNIKDDTTEIKPKISNVFTQSVDEITPEAKEITPGTDAPGTNAPGTDAPGTDVPEIEPQANLPTGGPADVINPAASKPEVTYERPEIDNPIETQPQTIEEPVNDDNYNQVAEQPAEIESQAKPDVKALNQPINFRGQVEPVPNVKVDHKTIVGNRERMSGHQQKGRKPKPPHKSHKKGTKKPAHAHKKPKRPVKEKTTRIEFDPDVKMIKQVLVQGNYRIKSKGEQISGHQQKGRKPKPPHKPHKKGIKKPTHGHEKPKRPVKEKTTTIEFDPDVKMIKQELILGNYRVKSTGERVSGHQQKGKKPKPPHKPHKKGTKKPTHGHEKPKRPVKEKTTTIEFDPDVKMIKQELILGNYRVKSTGERVSGHQQKGKKPKPPHKPHKKGTKKPTHAHEKPKKPNERTSRIAFDPDVKMIKQELVLENYRVKPTVDINVGRKTKLIYGGTRVPAYGRNFVRPQNKKCMQKPNGHKQKKQIIKPPKANNIRIKEHTRIRVHSGFLTSIRTKPKKNPNRHPHLAMPKKINPNKMKHAPSPKRGPSKCQCKICRAKLAQKTDHSARIRISAHITGRKSVPKTIVAHEKHIKRPLTLKNALTVKKARHHIRILGQEKIHIQGKLKQHSPRPVNVIRCHAKPKKHPPRPVNVLHHSKTVRIHVKPKIVRHPIVSAHPPRPLNVVHHSKPVRIHVKPKIVRHPIVSAHPPRPLNVVHHSKPVRIHAKPKIVRRPTISAHKRVQGKVRQASPRKRVVKGCGCNRMKRHISYEAVSIAAANSLQFDNWQAFGTCEYMVKRNARTYDNAETDCQALDAHLVSIHSEPENNFVHKITSTGSRHKKFEDFVWIGLRMNSKNQWEWVDGSPLDYKKWALNQPDHRNEGRCAQLYQGPANLTYVQDYHWNSFSCERPMKYYVCKRCKRPARVRKHTQG